MESLRPHSMINSKWQNPPCSKLSKNSPAPLCTHMVTGTWEHQMSTAFLGSWRKHNKEDSLVIWCWCHIMSFVGTNSLTLHCSEVNNILVLQSMTFFVNVLHRVLWLFRRIFCHCHSVSWFFSMTLFAIVLQRVFHDAWLQRSKPSNILPNFMLIQWRQLGEVLVLVAGSALVLVHI